MSGTFQDLVAHVTVFGGAGAVLSTQLDVRAESPPMAGSSLFSQHQWMIAAQFIIALPDAGQMPLGFPILLPDRMFSSLPARGGGCR
jgi:hypothetical protein